MMANPLEHLVPYLRSTLTPTQIKKLIESLGNDSVDPENVPAIKEIPAEPARSAAPVGLDEILKEMEEAYSEAKFSPLSPEESRRVRDTYPGFIERCSAFQGRHLVKVLRDKFK